MRLACLAPVVRQKKRAVQLNAFHVEEVFPDRFGVRPRRDWRKVPDHSVPDSGVAEIDLLSLLQLVREALRVRRADPDDEALLEELDVVGDCRLVEAGLAA